MLKYLEDIAREAGEVCLRESVRLTSDDVDFKGSRDLVTVVDQKVEELIVGRIYERFPGHDIFGEETGKTDRKSEYRWVIDPIDGTTSYFHKQPYYSVSIALQRAGVTEAAVVYGPALAQMFSAERGKGAWLNGEELLSASRNSEMINSVMATGFACLRAGREPNNLVYLGKVLPQVRDMRRCGSAALDLAYVAAGKVDGFWEMDLNLYDVAAGVLLVEEAGGVVTDMVGGREYPEKGIVAAGSNIHPKLLAAINS